VRSERDVGSWEKKKHEGIAAGIVKTIKQRILGFSHTLKIPKKCNKRRGVR